MDSFAPHPRNGRLAVGFTPAIVDPICSPMPRYELENTSLEITQGDITKQEVTAIANAANASLAGGGGVDGAIHRAAGPRLKESLQRVKKEQLQGAQLPTGQAVLTPGFELPARYVIHCVGPVYGRAGPELLASCYESALRICREQTIDSIAFPSISTGVYGYPVHEAAEVALKAVRDNVTQPGTPKVCRFVLFDDQTRGAYEQMAKRLLG